jgi:DNA-binding response OmpR family regulator
MATIILIDDNDSFVWAITRVLQKSGYSVLATNHGATALRHLDEEPVDLVITDLNLPGIDGLGIISEIRRRGLKVPIIAVSRRDSHGRQLQPAARPAIRGRPHHRKPFLPNCLLEQVTELVGSHALPADICTAMI